MKKCLIILIATAFIAVSVMPAMAQDYWGKEYFDKPWANSTGGRSLRDRFLENKKMDVDRFINSGQGEALINSYKLQILYKDPMDPAVIKHWDDKGIKKVNHNEDARLPWFAYVPKEALEKNNKEKFPLIFNMPHAEIFGCEGRGYVELAAKERLIVVIPSAEDLGFRTVEFALRHPEILAGVAFNCHLWPYLWEMPEKWIVDHLAKQKMPMVQYVGNVDFGIPIPLYEGMYEIHPRHGDDHLHTPQDNVDRANMWFRINGAREITLAEVMASAKSENKVEREIGAPVSRSKKAIIDDTEYYFGDFISSDGAYRMRVIAMDNVPHFPFGSMAEVTWEFLKHFSKCIY